MLTPSEHEFVDKLDDALDSLITWKCNPEGCETDQRIYAIEEAAEFAQALCKTMREPDSVEAYNHAFEEACDALCTTLTWLKMNNVSIGDIHAVIESKVERALKGLRP